MDNTRAELKMLVNNLRRAEKGDAVSKASLDDFLNPAQISCAAKKTIEAFGLAAAPAYQEEQRSRRQLRHLHGRVRLVEVREAVRRCEKVCGGVRGGVRWCEEV